MRFTRALGAIALTTWSKTAWAPSGAVASTPAPRGISATAWAPCPDEPNYSGLYEEGDKVGFWVGIPGSSACGQGVVTLQASFDGARWKNVASAHTDANQTATVSTACAPSGWTYRASFVSDTKFDGRNFVWASDAFDCPGPPPLQGCLCGKGGGR